jgi:hypothetical protein
MHYAIVFPQRKRDPARGNEDRADDVTALQRGAHKGCYCFEWESSGTRISPTLRSQSPITRASSANAWETPVRAAWTGKQNAAYP